MSPLASTLMDHYPFRKFITSSEDLFNIIQRVRDYRGMLGFHTGKLICEMYRGHGRSYWKLLPNLARSINNPNKLKKIEKSIVTDFHKELNQKGLTRYIQRGFLDGKFHGDWLLIQQAQHYRIPTRFMDWTIDWEVALFFAVSNPNDDNYDGHFWIYIVQPEMFVADNDESSYLHVDPFEFKETIFLNSSDFLSEEYLSKIAQRRKFRQNGRFCIQPHESALKDLECQDLHKPHLYPVVIPHYLKRKIREELAEKNITNESLYVDEEPGINQIVTRVKQKYGL
jgi:hypothetical protein